MLPVIKGRDLISFLQSIGFFSCPDTGVACTDALPGWKGYNHSPPFRVCHRRITEKR